MQPYQKKPDEDSVREYLYTTPILLQYSQVRRDPIPYRTVVITITTAVRAARPHPRPLLEVRQTRALALSILPIFCETVDAAAPAVGTKRSRRVHIGIRYPRGAPFQLLLAQHPSAQYNL